MVVVGLPQPLCDYEDCVMTPRDDPSTNVNVNLSALCGVARCDFCEGRIMRKNEPCDLAGAEIASHGRLELFDKTKYCTLRSRSTHVWCGKAAEKRVFQLSVWSMGRSGAFG
uniref:Uncharacterized protein n=1 Tax=Craspedostauros australis TaxID=1486917 RepID=A0A7R9ZRZ3_9STRA